jgi:hypothetical protein
MSVSKIDQLRKMQDMFQTAVRTDDDSVATFYDVSYLSLAILELADNLSNIRFPTCDCGRER